MSEIIKSQCQWYFPKARMNEVEYIEFKKLLLALDTSCSRFIRKAIREATKQGPDLLRQEFKVLEELAYQLGCIGRNLNQLVRLLHTDQSARISVDASLLQELLQKTEKVKAELYDVIQRSHKRWVKVNPRYTSEEAA